MRKSQIGLRFPAPNWLATEECLDLNRQLFGAVLLGLVAWMARVAPALAHGASPGEPTAQTILTSWSSDPQIIVGLLALAALYIWGFRRVQSSGPRVPFPGSRLVFFLAGLLVIFVATQSALETYDTTLFYAHMMQHVVLIALAAPLLVLGSPVNLALRAASPAIRRRIMAPLIQSRFIRLISHPLIAWLPLQAVLITWHLVPSLFDAALENEFVHQLQHLSFLAAAILFWWAVLGVNPNRWSLAFRSRAAAIALALVGGGVVSVPLLVSDGAIYPHYELLTRSWGPDPLWDQVLGATLMALFLPMAYAGGLLVVGAEWMAHAEKAASRMTARKPKRITSCPGCGEPVELLELGHEAGLSNYWRECACGNQDIVRLRSEPAPSDRPRAEVL